MVELYAADKTACTNELRMGGDSSYTELLTCLEMARDVRTMNARRSQAGRRARRHPRAARPRAAQAIAEELRTRQFEKAFRLSMIFSENRYPLFGIML